MFNKYQLQNIQSHFSMYYFFQTIRFFSERIFIVKDKVFIKLQRNTTPVVLCNYNLNIKRTLCFPTKSSSKHYNLYVTNQKPEFSPNK